MGKRFTGETADIQSVIVDGSEVRITAIAGDVAATTTVKLGCVGSLDELVECETTVALSLAERIDASVQRGIRSSRGIVDDGLREGPVVGCGSDAYFAKGNAACETAEARVRSGAYFAKGNDLPDDDWIRIPNSEYADLVATARRDAAFREAFTGIVGRDDSEVDLEALNAAFSGIPSGPYDAILHSAGWEVRQLDTDPTDKHHWPVRLCQGIAGQKAGFDGPTAFFIAGVLNAWPLIAAHLAATTRGEAAPDVSDAAQDDGGPVEPELDIDALVAGVGVQRDTCALDIRAVRSGEYPAMTVTATGPGTADLLGRIISNILDERALSAEVTLGVACYRPAESDVGEFASTPVDPVADAEVIRPVVKARF